MGTLWPKSGSIEFDNSAVRAAGAKAYFYEGGTTTPLAVYEDHDETTPHDDPVLADANGRWPSVYIPYTTSYDVKVTTSGGTQLYYPTEIANPNPVEAAADTVTDDEKWLTGDLKFRFSTGTLTGYVRANGRTMGNAASGGTERANADTVDLFTHLYDNFANTILAVSGGRGASAAADYAANKTITLPDMRSGVPIGVDDMGNSAASRAGSITYTNGNSTTGGSHCGANTHALTSAQLAAHTHSFSATTGAGGAHTHALTAAGAASGGAHTHTSNFNSGAPSSNTGTVAIQTLLTGNQPIGATTTIMISGGSTNVDMGSHTHVVNGDTDSQGAHTHTLTGSTDAESSHTHSVSGTSGSTGSGTAHNIVQYGVSGTFYIKL